MRPFVSVLAGLLALALGVNVLGAWDQARQDARMRAAAARLRPGLAMAFDGYVDERRFQAARLQTIGRPRVVAFGSSRVREVSSATVGAAPGEFYNLGMSAATVEDHIALWSLLKRRGLVPDTAVFSADAWALSRAHGQARWLALAGEVDRFVQAAGEARGPAAALSADVLYRWYRARDLLSYAVLRESVRDLERLAAGRKRRGDDLIQALAGDLVPDAEAAGKNAIRADGSVIRPAGPDDPTPEAIRREVVRHVTAGPYGLVDFQWDPDRAARLALLWRDMRAHGVRLVVYTPPYHPAAWALLRASPRYAAILDSTTAFLARLAREVGARFVDASDPASIPCPETEFHDVQHASAACLGRLWRGLRP